MATKNQPHFTPDEIAAHRKAREDRQAEQKKEADAAAAQTAKERRAQLEADVKEAFLAAGGLSTEWPSMKRRLIEEALVRRTLEPAEDEPARKVAAPYKRSRW